MDYKLKLFIAILFFFIGWQAKLYLSDKQERQQDQKIEKSQTLLEKIKAKKRLDVVILNSSTVYYIGRDTELGFEYDLISSYAKDIGVDLNLSVVYTVAEALQKTRDGVGDITVASLSVTDERKKEFRFGPRYYTIQEQLICSNTLYKKKKFPYDLEDLAELNITVGKDTSYEATLLELSSEITDLKFNTSTEYSTEQLLELVNTKKIDCSVVDSNIFLINQRYYTDISRALILGERKNIAWIIRDGDDSVNKSLYRWLNNYERSGKMAELRDHYYSFLSIFDYYDTKIFYKRLKKRFPKYKKYFKDAGKKYGVPWELLAAQSYQESHWNPKAKSHTGVRGMMMITLSTAKHLGVKNRLNAKQSIYGGAKYLAQLEKRFPDDIKGRSRWAFTLAAYNIGMGHIHDAQILARKLNKNPYSWTDMKTILPLLTQKKYYKELKYGYARGNEPVKYVNSIQNYLDIILQTDSIRSQN
ncbi:MAG: membrane-bound lytic murein transglycosylase MltF [Campylobacterota bacterium]|nr:membrane-bound lytic murein transglycosylase MltF [Campylobacterota bacterium]